MGTIKERGNMKDEVDARYIATCERNARAEVRGKVRRVLEAALPNIRLYLERPEPNTEGALFHISRIEDLLKDLENSKE